MLWLAASPADAKPVEYRAVLNGQSPSISTGSKATGTATILVDKKAGTVSVSIDVTGLTVDALWDQLVGAPIGPIHLHRYGSTDLSDASSSQLAFPVPFGKAYKATATGFRVRTGPVNYTKGVAPLGQDSDMDAFVAALEKGAVVVNIHTDAFNDGEINGAVTRATRS